MDEVKAAVEAVGRRCLTIEANLRSQLIRFNPLLIKQLLSLDISTF